MFLCKISRFTFFSSYLCTQNTIVAIHLVRKCKSEGLDVYYLNDRSGECDFVVCKGNQVIRNSECSRLFCVFLQT